jgi:hypothetical protein
MALRYSLQAIPPYKKLGYEFGVFPWSKFDSETIFEISMMNTTSKLGAHTPHLPALSTEAIQTKHC